MGPGSAGRPRPTLELAHDANPGPGRTVALPHLRPQNAESQDSAGQRPGTAPACFLDPAATYNTVLTANPDRRLWQLLLPIALLAERSSRRHARSPGEAGGGRSDLCHDNDETDPVNRRTRIGDKVVEARAELFAGEHGLLEFITLWLPSRDKELPPDSQQRKSELGDHGKRSKCSCRRHVEGFSSWASVVVLESRVDSRYVREAKPGGRCLDPIESATLRVDQGERGRSMRHGQGKPRQSGTRSKVSPTLPRLGFPDCHQAKGVVEVSFPESFLLSRAQEPELNCLGIGLFQDLYVMHGQRRPPRRMLAVTRMFHVKR